MTLRRALIPAVFATTLFTACSSPPPKTTAEPAKPAEPVDGRYAFHQAYVMARTWAQDLELLRVRNIPVQADIENQPGKAPVWEVTFVSPSKQRAKSFTYSVVRLENIHEGVFGGLEESYTGPRGQATPFPIAALKTGTVQAWEAAAKESKPYMEKNPDSPISYLLEKTPRHPNPAWRVIWGTSVATSAYSIFVDASTGQYLERMR